jgi:16S rRNA (cytidine1402-2'-O)-methyltransferase
MDSTTKHTPVDDVESALPPGLYLVATPIGHLEDITLRALHILRSVSVIAAEDTRTAQKLLRAHGIQRPLVSLYRDNEAQRTPQIIARLQRGESVAVISEAGTPCVSDPGFVLVRAAAQEGCRIVPVPGPSAVIAAIAASGLPSHHFVFLGFLPAKSGRRKRVLTTYQQIPATLVLYESPHRVLALLEDVLLCLGDRPACLARELTKVYEEFVRGTVSELLGLLRQRDAILGECVVLVGGATEAEDDEGMPIPGAIAVENGQTGPTKEEIARELLATGGRPAKLARQLTARVPTLSRKEAYRLLETLKEES